MDNDEQRDHAEEAYNRALMREEGEPATTEWRVGQEYAAGVTVIDIEDEPGDQVSLDLSDGRVVVEDGQRAAVATSTDGEGYPLERDGRVVWACCESSIGGPCGHAIGGNGLSGRDRVETLAELVQEWADQGGPLQECMDRMGSALERLCAPPMTEDERAAVVSRIAG